MEGRTSPLASLSSPKCYLADGMFFVCSCLAQIDLGRVRSVSGVATQGHHWPGNFVKSYKLNYSTDGTTWQSYREKPNGGIKVQRHSVAFYSDKFGDCSGALGY